MKPGSYINTLTILGGLWMRKLLAAFFLIAMPGDLIRGRADEPAPANQAVWLSDYEQARAIARQQGKPLFVVFRCQH